MKIYTKKGDKGETSLLGGSKVNKDNIRLEAYGTVDELNAFIGHIHDQEISENHKTILLKIQNQLFNLGSVLSFDGKKSQINLPEITKTNIQMLEAEIDRIEEMLSPLKDFILPSGHTIASLCHIARTVCRRAERRVVELQIKERISPNCLEYLNRLSDYLFVLARGILKEKNCSEITWIKF
ncbi:MAG: cob(I)yrinic acid a,c-diamide adenosyltransferase [Flavobacteriales bacterium]|jgi:cob(I)alamin adenosyltransferase|nr:cob(I)yrinic acid a,c-diamide adenosyltransferase [Flavobacteriales bacterium]MDP7430283.1 cob(I)yrinic acid a,c-diamide adenosyltransferase [Flavobacteriales bacterium]HJN63917.1 cob(I)yrinic acid a,c-diamide adenosyltransferase [Flavobacteriales bacterium]|tara:strand:+ start:1785 stop:2330 length:546 start_codon:yes stop_codon:yes gene_type:complete